MKLYALTFSLLLLLGTAASAGLAAKADPLVGRWLWADKQFAVFNADGTASVGNSFKGTWVYTQNSEVQRKYTVIWNEGQYSDKVTLSEDQQTVQVQNIKGANGMKSTFSRAIEAPSVTLPRSGAH